MGEGRTGERQRQQGRQQRKLLHAAQKSLAPPECLEEDLAHRTRVGWLLAHSFRARRRASSLSAARRVPPTIMEQPLQPNPLLQGILCLLGCWNGDDFEGSAPAKACVDDDGDTWSADDGLDTCPPLLDTVDLWRLPM